MKLTRQEQAQRNRIMLHCFKNKRTMQEEHRLIILKKSELSRIDRDYLVSEIIKSQEQEERLEANRKRKINSLK